MKVFTNKWYFIGGIFGGVILGLNIIKRLEERTLNFNKDISQIKKLYLKVRINLYYITILFNNIHFRK